MSAAPNVYELQSLLNVYCIPFKIVNKNDDDDDNDDDNIKHLMTIWAMIMASSQAA